MAWSLEREIRRKADIHDPQVRSQLANLNRVTEGLLPVVGGSGEVERLATWESERKTESMNSKSSSASDLFDRMV